MYIPQQSVTSWKVIMTCFHLFSLSVSAWRLWFRYRTRRLWMDDYIFIPALFLYVVNIAVMWILFSKRESSNKVALYWLAAIPWHSIIWLTRISLVLCISRIFPDLMTFRRCARGMAIAFGIVYAGIMLWLVTTPCNYISQEKASVGFTLKLLNCNEERYPLTITAFVADIWASSFLFVFPIVCLSFMQLPGVKKTLVVCYLFGNTLVFLSAVVYCIFSFHDGISGVGEDVVTGMLSQIELMISLLVSNSVLVGTYIYAKSSRSDAVDEPIECHRKDQNEGDWSPLQAFAVGNPVKAEVPTRLP